MLRKYKILCSEEQLKQQGFEVAYYNEKLMFKWIYPNKCEKYKCEEDSYLTTFYVYRTLYYDRATHILEAYNDYYDKTINCRKCWVKDLINKGYVEELC